MIDRQFEGLTVNGACDLTNKNIIAGSPLTIGANGYKLCGADTQFVGLSMNYYFVGKDDVNGGEWFADSQQIGVFKIGQALLQADEIDGVKVYPFKHDDAFAAGDALYVGSDGKLTKTAPGEDSVAVAHVVSYSDGKLVVFVNAQN